MKVGKSGDFSKPHDEEKESSGLAQRLIATQFNLENQSPEPLFGTKKQTDDLPEFHFRQRPTLESVLRQSSLQLPFKDTRVYLVDSYDPGWAGSVDRFWDTVSVPFGFTTRNNTRVQCVWVLVLAGCGWGHTSLFHKKAKRRKNEDAGFYMKTLNKG